MTQVVLHDLIRNRLVGIDNRDGLWWYEAPAPFRDGHVHEAWTIAKGQGDRYAILRCACGATNYSDFSDLEWIEDPKGRFALGPAPRPPRPSLRARVARMLSRPGAAT